MGVKLYEKLQAQVCRFAGLQVQVCRFAFCSGVGGLFFFCLFFLLITKRQALLPTNSY